MAPHTLVLSALLVVGCGGNVTVQKAACVDDESCLSGETCVAGLCQHALEEESCANDAECDMSAGQLCVANVCTVSPTVAPDSCTETRDCPIADFCNTAGGQCEPLRAGFCRLDDHCSGSTPMCDTPTPAQPGRCVECRADTDCDGGVCGQGGVCVGDGATVDCPAHASLVPGSTTVCQCDPGFLPDVTTSTCVAQDAGDPGQGDPPPPTSTCVPHASPVPGIPGQCRCDSGYQPSTDGSACVTVGGTTPPPPPPPPPPSGGGTGGGDPGGGDTGGGSSDDSCGPNAIPVFFLCVCFPGYVVADSGNGCTLESGGGSGGGSDGGGGGDCPPNSSLESDGSCYCDTGYVVDSSGTQCVADECAELGYYGDGYFCDDFCPQPDPDC